VFKVARHISDNDLVENEAYFLGGLYPPDAVENGFYRYIPKPLSSTKIDGLAANVMSYAEGFITFADILEAYPDGIDYRDLAWMFKRTLAGIGFAHNQGAIHGALVPTHVLVHPTGHGAKIVDWSYAVKAPAKSSVKAYVAKYKAYYPPEIFDRQFPGPEADLYMVAKCCVALLGGDVATNEMPDTVPSRVVDFLGRMLAESPGTRKLRGPAWDLHDQFDQLLKELVGKPRYRAFSLPAAP